MHSTEPGTNLPKRMAMDSAGGENINTPAQRFPWILLLQLAIVNSIGFSGATIVPVWVADIGGRVGMEPWFGGLVASTQLIATAVANLLTPVLFGKVPPAKLAKIALPCAAFSYLLTQTGLPYVLLAATVIGGAFLGIVLNSTNRIIAESEHVQKGYSIFQVMEGVFSGVFILIATMVVASTDLINVYLCNAAVCLIAFLLIWRLPVGKIAPRALDAAHTGARIPFGAVFGLLAIFIFFIGQNSILSYSVPLGRNMGLSASFVTSTVSIALVVSLIGALLADFLGERWGLRIPIIGSTLLLLGFFLVITVTASEPVFLAGIFWMALTTMFIVPYFFTVLARLDSSGRVASVGPAFLLGGVAVGSAMAAAITTNWGVEMIGPAAAVALFVSTLLTFAATRKILAKS